MRKFEMAGMLMALAVMAMVVGVCWPGKRHLAAPHHAAAARP